MKKFGGIDINTKERSYFTDNEFQEIKDNWDVVTIMGFPEGTIITILERYLYYRIEKTWDINKSMAAVEHERDQAGFPSGFPQTSKYKR